MAMDFENVPEIIQAIETQWADNTTRAITEGRLRNVVEGIVEYFDREGGVNGTMSFVADGLTADFLIPHQAGGVPTDYEIVPVNVAAQGLYGVAVDATNLIAQFDVMPAKDTYLLFKYRYKKV